MSVPLPICLTFEDIENPAPTTLKTLWEAWQIDLTPGIDQRTEAYKEIIDFIAKLDPYDTTYRQHLASDRQLFQAHMAQAFRHSRTMLLLSTPSLLPPSSSGTTRDKETILRLIDWCKGRKDRTYEEAVRSANGDKDAGNKFVSQGRYDDAVWMYISGLASLLPWSSDATMMTFDQAGEMGLRQIEQALLKNIAVAANKAAGGKKKVNKNWVTIFAAAITCLEHHPFATWDGVVKRLQLQKESIEKYRSCWSHTAITTFEKRAEMLPIWKTMPADEWAHAGCGVGHSCCVMVRTPRSTP